MAVKLTKRNVDTEQAGTKDRVVFDPEVKGFGLKITPAGKKLFILQYRMGGRGTPTKRYTIAEMGEVTPEQARGIAIQLRGQIRSGIDPQAEKKAKAAPPKKAKTFNDVANGYLAYARKRMRDSTYREAERIINHDLKSRWGDLPIGGIAKSDVRDLLNEIAERGAPVQSNRTLARLKTFFAWAVEQDIVPASPAADIKPITNEKTRDRALTDQEIVWFWNGCDAIGQPFGPLFKLLLTTAQRREEVAGLDRAELDIGKKVWIIPRERAKNDRAHEVHLSALALEIIETVPAADDCSLVFTTNNETPVAGFSRAKRRLDKAMREARRKSLGLPEDDAAYLKVLALPKGKRPPVEIADWILHDLRRSAATSMAKMNIAPHVVDRILNHVSGSIDGVAAIYNRHAYLDERRSALEAWGRYLSNLIKPAPSNVTELRPPAVGQT